MPKAMLHTQLTTLVVIVFCCFTGCLAPPVNKKPAATIVEKKPGPADDLLKAYSPDDYKRYVEEVMAHLHADKHFKSEWEKFKNSTHKMSAGDLASQLEFVDHSVRSRLDEIKRKEVDRLNALEKMLEAKRAAAGDPMREAGVPIHPDVFNMDQDTIRKAHLDHENPHSFEASDLEKLIRQVVSDMHRVDEAKQEQYKQYEMMKEHLRLRKLHKINDTKAREAAEKEFQEEKKKHKQHEKIHHPGSKEQLQDTWVEDDHLDKESFNPKTFFLLHDVNGDGHLDVNEIEALFLKELEKVYNRTNDTTVNAFEKQHEMERMRQEVLDKVDTNKDLMISWEEFQLWTKNPEFKKDDDWKTTEEDDAPPYKDDEFKQYEDDYDREHPDEDDDRGGRHDRDRDRDDHDSREHDDRDDRRRGGRRDDKEHHDKDDEHHDKAPEHHDKAPEHHDKAPEHHDKAPEHHDRAPEHHGKAPEHHDKAPEHHDKAPEHHDKAPEHHDKAPEHHDKAPEHHDKAPEHHDKAPEHHDKAPEHHDKAPEHHDKAPEHHDKAPEHHETQAPHPVPGHK